MDTGQADKSVTLRMWWRGRSAHEKASMTMLELAVWLALGFLTNGLAVLVGLLGILALLIYLLLYLLYSELLDSKR